MTTAAHALSKNATGGLKAGFAEPVADSQEVFRSAMNAFGYAGRPFEIGQQLDGPTPFNTATSAFSLALMDFETSVWLQTQSDEAASWLRFHCGLPTVEDKTAATFAIITDPQSMPSLTAFHAGEIEYPECSTTLVIQVPSLVEGPKTTWAGPGINGSIEVAIAGLPSWFWSLWDLNRELYPRGIDAVFTCGNAMIALPRTVHVEFEDGSVA
ncbi:phosphonate C-P lyase system protein PhnH [Rhizobium miluonense]|uniref:Alpha-D-ribose 1-methylphosphonate 5-triphosphate synthase subunit PhnH n=1 Tax=Rhizobium miluonense TaxID=411945 RepID=A0A1C3WE59_9HYPH|nr:phosphonate C-P lyase system protein PhnH [Rhizobium miluonense]SCB38148.1 alpha-D-ribose 1-methylphosphonate 5-triphosphate synthase subunit PhnH [Rhizobium miluonense]